MAVKESRGKQTSTWRPIASAPKYVPMWKPVDLWLTVHASPMSFGLSDAWRVPDCWRSGYGDGEKWLHKHDGKEAELNDWYITHWMPVPGGPNGHHE